jgi:ferrochelatase
LNESELWMQALTQIALENLHGWVSANWDNADAKSTAELTKLRAQSLGAKQ